jgi:hypothetical protein
VDIGWGTEGETFTMGWTEREGPPVSAPQKRAFGTLVMKTMAERSVDGMVDLDFLGFNKNAALALMHGRLMLSASRMPLIASTDAHWSAIPSIAVELTRSRTYSGSGPMD